MQGRPVTPGKVARSILERKDQAMESLASGNLRAGSARSSLPALRARGILVQRVLHLNRRVPDLEL